MRKVYILVCVVLALVLGTLPAAAQETTFGLDAEDFTAFVNANDDSLEQTQYSFDYAVDFNLAGTNVPAITVALTGSGALDIINEQISLSVDGTADFAGQSTPLSAELLRHRRDALRAGG